MKEYIIIGNSAAGINAAEAIREWDKECKITIISDEAICPDISGPYGYSRCLLPNYLAGEMSREDIIIRDTKWYKSNDIKIILGKKVIKVDEKEKKVIFNTPHILGEHTGLPLHYDSLLIATGGSPIFPSIDGINNHMVFGFRTVLDADRLLKVLPEVRNAVVLGAGFIGLKVAYALWKRGIRVTIIEKLSHLLPRMLDIQSASIIANRLNEKGIGVRVNSTVAEIVGNKNRLKGVRLETGEVIKCDLVIVAVGIKSNIELIEDTSINRNQGILVDEYMRTNVPDIYAAGDVAEGIDFLSGSRAINAIWPSATRGGRVAGYNMVTPSVGLPTMSGAKRYDNELPMNAIEIFGIPVVSMGIVENSKLKTQNSKLLQVETVCYSAPEKNIYKKIVLQNGKIVGMIFVGDIRKAGIILSLIKRREDVSLIKSELLNSEVLAHSPMTTKFRNLLHYPK